MDIHGGGDYYDSDDENYRNKNILPVEQKYSNGSYNRSPKHKIRTPIIEETDSIDGNTALSLAASEGNSSTVELLLSKRANVICHMDGDFMLGF